MTPTEKLEEAMEKLEEAIAILARARAHKEVAWNDYKTALTIHNDAGLQLTNAEGEYNKVVTEVIEILNRKSDVNSKQGE